MNYDFKVDMWSVGCMLAELIFCQTQNKKEKDEAYTQILFKGSSCFPLSPCHEMLQNPESEFNIVDSND